jgi:ATP-dependent protease ClpP protease subunit
MPKTAKRKILAESQDATPIAPWFGVANAPNGDMQVLLYDVIGSNGVSAEALVSAIKTTKAATIRVNLNTVGGSVFDGVAIYNALVDSPARVITKVDGVAASIGSVIALAGDEVRMADNAMMMIHNPRSVAVGGADDMRSAADFLDKVKDTIVGTYAAKTGKTPREMSDLMDAETWFAADEAVAIGLVDAIDKNDQPGPLATPNLNYGVFNVCDFKNVPDAIRQRVPATSGTYPGRTSAVATAPATATVTKEPNMTPEVFAQYAVEHPDAPEVKSLIATGYTAGKAEASAKEATIAELKDAFPGDNGFVIDQLTAKATMAQATKAYVPVLIEKLKVANAAVASKDALLAERDAKIAQLTADLAKEQGSPAPLRLANMAADATPTADVSDLPVDKQAEMEFAASPKLQAEYDNNKRAYVKYRVNMSRGNITKLSAVSAGAAS